MMGRRLGWGVVLAGLVVVNAWAQAACEQSTLELRLLCTTYRWDGPVISAYFRTVDATAYPAFAGLTVAAWGGVVTGHWSQPAAQRITLSAAATTALVLGLKALFRRDRPFETWADIDSRGDPPSSYAFPSGHAALAFTLATAWSLEVRRVYVAVPAYLWATSVAIGRVWKGVHYPTDVLIGAALGTGVAWSVRQLWP